MTIIKSYLWMLQNKKAGELNDKQMDYLLKAVNNTELMIKLINDILNISRMDQGKLSFNIKKLRLFDLIVMEKGIELKIEDFDNDMEVYTDETKFKEILTNLLGNSVKFTKQGGIGISVEDLGDGGFAKLKIVDTGAGISETDLPKLFLKFGRLDNSYTTVAESGGSGLGLHIVKMYVEAMGGEVGAYSAGILKGSTFWFTVPKFKVEVKLKNAPKEGELGEVKVVS
jgi:signal transduction histidine kinase